MTINRSKAPYLVTSYSREQNEVGQMREVVHHTFYADLAIYPYSKAQNSSPRYDEITLTAFSDEKVSWRIGDSIQVGAQSYRIVLVEPVGRHTQLFLKDE